jgi:hypothetical protein
VLDTLCVATGRLADLLPRLRAAIDSCSDQSKSFMLRRR